jgi:hypothetical protein
MRQLFNIFSIILLSVKSFSFCFEPTVEKYTILQNENLSVVLARFQLHPIYSAQGSVEKVAKINHLKNKNLVTAGQEIFLVQPCGAPTEQKTVAAPELLPQVSEPAYTKEEKVSPAYDVHVQVGSFTSRLDFKANYLDATIYSKNQIMAVLGVKKFFEAKDFFYEIEVEFLKYDYDTRANSDQKFVINPSLNLGYQYRDFESSAQLSRQEHPLLFSQFAGIAEIFWSSSIAASLGLGYSYELNSLFTLNPNLSVMHLSTSSNKTKVVSMINYGFGTDMIYKLNAYQFFLSYNYNALSAKGEIEDHKEATDKISLGIVSQF